MAELLVIKAHPLTANESKTLKALDTFTASYRKAHAGDTITTLDLYNDFIPEIDFDLLNGWQKSAQANDLSAEEAAKVKRFSELTEQFLSVDKVVIANALWNLNIPTRLKAWIDTINVAGKTFRYTENGPKGLTENKKLLHIQSNGGVYNGNDYSSQYIKGIFNFIGVNDVTQLFIEGIDYDPEKRDVILNAALSEAEKIGEQF
ncbi:FMN-dependent NADH-azoreductase [Vagococcus acidifermentans]|uniref:FMN dependent NADH:quinone oxidoreductase n=1 Tax=Vagococcus acidifermentans TaxID=564710 RepID=A0A430AVK9_9ENTE|nr:FMN-dependent NADH-azoreductase [Vagococcus acidifermentans]RSU12100.1 FMN-dependent NADH-azoreductase [Vagococcus acidifermentans]